MAASAILVIVSMFFISMVFIIDPWFELHLLLGLEISTALFLTLLLHRHSRRVQRVRDVERGIAPPGMNASSKRPSPAPGNVPHQSPQQFSER